MDTREEKLSALRTYLGRLDSVLLAYSGGVDSAFLLWAVLDVLGSEHVLAVTAQAPMFTHRELTAAQTLAQQLGARHRLVQTGQMADEDFVQNPPQRCYLCKRETFGRLLTLAQKEGYTHVLDGSNIDDQGEYRPGLRAVRELGIESPLAAAGLTKADIRALSRQVGLLTWDQPAQTCLMTRFPYDTPITVTDLARVEAAEDALRKMGFEALRVRSHGPVARIEIASERVPELAQTDVAARVVSALREAGYRYVTLDLEGYRRGRFDLERRDLR